MDQEYQGWGTGTKVGLGILRLGYRGKGWVRNTEVRVQGQGMGQEH